MVLQFLTDKKAKRHTLAGYAVVCKEWQAVVEQATFKSLQITSHCVSQFGNTVRGERRRWLKQVSLSIKLPTYPQKLSRTAETEAEQSHNNMVFTSTISGLFDVLGQWTMDQVAPGGLELELSARSPSDRKKLFGENGLDAATGDTRYFDSDLHFDFVEGAEYAGTFGLPSVEVVTWCSITRRNFRNFSPQALLTIFSSLPNLSRITYEPFHQVDPPAQADVDTASAFFILFWPATLKSVSLYEHDDAFEYEDLYEDDEVTRIKYRKPLAGNIAKLSRRLEELNVANLCDARHIFEPFFEPQKGLPLPFWKDLRKMTLTAGVIAPSEEWDDTNELLQAAGNAARRMPVLRLMELYQAGGHFAGVFRYRVTEESTSLSWQSTWEFKVSHDVKETWKDVCRQHTSRELDIASEELIENYRGWPRFICGALETTVVHPVSARLLRNL